MIKWIISNFTLGIKWVIDNFTFDIKLSLIALLVSIWTAYKSRTFFKVKWGNNCEIKMNNSVVAMKKDGTPEISYTDTFLTYLTVVNPSPNDLAYYDLKVYDADNGNPLEIIYAIYFHLNDDHTYFVHYLNPLNSNLLELPEKNHGVFKANSYTRFNLPIVVTDEYEYKDLKHIKIEFKVAKNSFRKTKIYSKTYDVTGWQRKPYRLGYGQDIKINILTKRIVSLEVKDHIVDNEALFKNLNKIHKVLQEINTQESSRSISLITLREISDIFRFIIDKEIKHDLNLVNQLKAIQNELKKNDIVNDKNSDQFFKRIDHDISLIYKIWY